MPEPSPAPAPGLDLDDFLCFALHSAAQAAVRANKPALDKLGLTYPQFLAMAALWAADNQTVGGLGAKLFLDSSTLTPLLKRLEAAGLLRRERDPKDPRKLALALTDKGTALRAEAERISAGIGARLGPPLD